MHQLELFLWDKHDRLLLMNHEVVVQYGGYPTLDVVNKILVVKLRSHGDVLLTSPLFALLKERFPAASIGAYLYHDTLPMLEGHPAIDHFLLCDRRARSASLVSRIGSELKRLWQIRLAHYDLVINLTEGDRGALAARCSRARIRVGMDPGNSGIRGKGSWYTHLVKGCQTPRHTVERDLDALRRIGIFPPPEGLDLVFQIPKETMARLQERLAAVGLRPGGFLLLHPTARWRFKSLPVSTLAAVVARWREETGLPVLLSSGPGEDEIRMIEEIAAQLDSQEGIVSFAGTLSLKELGGLISLAKVTLSADSAALHLASAVKAPIVATFGPTSELRWGPWRNPYARIVTSNQSCRPCFQDGCGGSKRSECLVAISAERLVSELKIAAEVGFASLGAGQ